MCGHTMTMREYELLNEMSKGDYIIYREDVCDTTLVTQAYTATRKIQRLVTLDDKDP